MTSEAICLSKLFKQTKKLSMVCNTSANPIGPGDRFTVLLEYVHTKIDSLAKNFYSGGTTWGDHPGVPNTHSPLVGKVHLSQRCQINN